MSCSETDEAAAMTREMRGFFRPNHRDKEMSEEEEPVRLIRGSGKDQDPPFTFAPAVK